METNDIIHKEKPDKFHTKNTDEQHQKSLKNRSRLSTNRQKQILNAEN